MSADAMPGQLTEAQAKNQMRSVVCDAHHDACRCLACRWVAGESVTPKDRDLQAAGLERVLGAYYRAFP